MWDAIAYYIAHHIGCHCYMLYHLCHPSKMKDTNI